MTDHVWEIWSDTTWGGEYLGVPRSLRIFAPTHDAERIKFIAAMTCSSLLLGPGVKITLPRNFLLPELRRPRGPLGFGS